jgi:SPP1 family predicted phage head-tail adaptor
MRAGKLDRIINIEVATTSQDPGTGETIETWGAFATGLRAQIVQSSTEEYFRASGEGAASTIVFRTRFIAGVTNLHRIVYEGRNFDIEEVKELGRARGLELRAKAPA